MMEIKDGEHAFRCVCNQVNTKVDPFLKILDLADIGLKIYKYLTSKYAQVAGIAAATQKSGTGTDVFIVQNTQDKDLPSSHLIQELDAKKISCPKCKQVVAHAKRLIETLPSVNKGNVVAICDHCRKKAEPRYACEACENIVKKFISSEDKRKQQRSLHLGRSLSNVDLRNITSTPKRIKYDSIAAAAGYKPKKDDSSLEIQKQLEQKLTPCFVKSQHEGGERDELRKQFQKVSLIRTRSETFLNAVSGLTQEILDKTFQYYFPKGARQIMTGKVVTSEEFIKDTQEKYRLITEARERIHEGSRRSATGLELQSEEYYDEHGKPICIGKMPEVYYDQHGQLVRRGKTPHIYYDKNGQPISGGVMPDIYYDKYGQPVQGTRMPEVFYDEHGQPVPAGRMPHIAHDKHGQSFLESKPPQVYYDKYGQPLQTGKSTEIYYDEHGESFQRGKSPELYYDKHGQQVQRGKSPEIYYDKHGSPISQEPIPEVHYDKHGRPISEDRTPEVYYDKHGQPITKEGVHEVYHDKKGQSLQRGKSPEVYYDKHGKPMAEGHTPEIYYDKHGQPIQRGKLPQVYHDKHGQPIPRDRIADVYYDKQGKPITSRSPEVYNYKHGLPIQRGKSPESFYDKHGQPIKVQKAAEVYYDEHGQPVTRTKIPEIFYDKHGQPIKRDTLPDAYYDKDGQLKKAKPTSEVHYDKHGRLAQRDQAPEIHYDKDGHPTQGEKFAKAQNDEHGKQVQVGRKGGLMSEIFYDQHGKSVRGGRKGGHLAAISHDQDGKPETVKEEKEKELERKQVEDKQKPQKGEKMYRDAIESERKTVDDKVKPRKALQTEQNIFSKEEKSKKILENKVTQIPSKVEKNSPSEYKKDKNTAEGKDKITQMPSKGEKNISPNDKNVGKVMEGKDKTPQLHSKGEKQTIQEKTISEKKDTIHHEKPTNKSTISPTAKDEAGKISTDREKPKSKDEELQKPKGLEDRSKIKNKNAKEQKSVKISGHESKDKDVNRKDVKVSEEKGKQKDGNIMGEKRKQKDNILVEDKEKRGKAEIENQQDTKQQKQPAVKKQKDIANSFEDKPKETKRQKEDKINQDKESIKKQKEEKENAEKLKTEKVKEKEGKTRKLKEDQEDKLMQKALDMQNKQKLEAEKMKKANLEQIQKMKNALSKVTPQPLKVSEGTQKPEKREPPQPFKIDEKLVSKSTKLVKKKSIETPNKELDIKAIQIMKPSNEDMIARLVTVKPTKKMPVPKISKQELVILGKIHKGHADDGLKDSQCNLCVYSELLFQLEELNEKKLMNEKKEVIIGNKVKKIIAKDFVKVKEEIQEVPVPALFKTMFTIEPTADVYDKIKSTDDPAIDEYQKFKQKPILVGNFFDGSIMSTTKKVNVLLQQQGDQDSKGVIKYALSDRSFIDKGWTLLPTEKVVRKMNVYRMRPAHPEFDWFEHNKNKRYLEYDSGEKLAEIDDNGRGRWFYRNGRVAMDYYDAEETNAQQRFVIYSSGEPDERGRTHPYTVLATFDYLGNGIVVDHGGKIRLKYNQSEGVVLDRSLGPVSHWKWHSLNDPPVLQQVMIDTQMSFKDPEILKLGDQIEETKRQDNEEMLAIEFDNFIKEKSKKLTQKFKPFQIKMKALKINEQFSLRILDQATIYLLFRDGSTNLKLNMGMLLDHQEIVDTDTAEMGDVANNIEKLPARTDSIAALQASISNAQREARLRVERDRRLCPPVPRCSADQLRAAASRRLRQPIVPAPSASTSAAERHCLCRKPPYNNNLYYDTRII